MCRHLQTVAALLCAAAPRVSGIAHDTVLPHHTPARCRCAPWANNASAVKLWENATAAAAAGVACAMPANAVTPDLALPDYSPADGWCLADCGGDGGGAWYTWCVPPRDAPSGINLLVVNASTVGVNFVTADMGVRAGCRVVAELRAAGAEATAGSFTGYSTLYRDPTAARALSYHHVALHNLAPRTSYEYRVRVSDVPAAPPGAATWRRTAGVKWCSGGNFELASDPFGQGFAGGDTWCPLLPPGAAPDAMVAMCEAVCGAANASACGGFTFYPAAGGVGAQCCFRTSTASKPPAPASTAVCYEKVGFAGPCSAAASAWSSWLGFTSLYDEGVTKLALYADMGVFVTESGGFPKVPSLPAPAQHNIGNVMDDVAAGRVDWVIHSGDHAYEFEVNGGARGDGYMDAYSALLAHAPWAPGWGNHEYLELDRGNRLAHIAAGLISERQTVQGATRMFYSVDVGLLHLLHLDLSPYWCRFSGCGAVDTCGFPDEWVADASATDPDARYNFTGYRAAVMDFMRRDLAAVDRARTPWVMVTAHYPLYETFDNTAPMTEADFGARGDGAAGTPSKAQAALDFEPMLAEFGVDFYFAGHNHNYEATWPVYKGRVVGHASYTDPQAPIHILSGSAGPPEPDLFSLTVPAWSRERSRLTVNSYTRLTLYNASVAAFEQVANGNSTTIDAFTVVQTRADRSAPFTCFEGC
eukprot:TRINITY_DN19154_c0_g1_i1.p1 TRINITY_DN19154_c0_g1~~TRINITY_DN19154_c0_g1_i1.p1  ORF type:complete len:700 (+),score=165.83 TRINITY_DN19154_c0_g1_i1:37-2136(+)